MSESQEKYTDEDDLAVDDLAVDDLALDEDDLAVDEDDLAVDEDDLDEDDLDEDDLDEDDLDKPKIIIGDEIDKPPNAIVDYDIDPEEEEIEIGSDDENSDDDPGIVMKTSIVQEAVVSDGDDSDDDDSDDEDYLKKFDADVVTNYIDIYHPESRMHNYDEVRAMSCVIKDETGVIIDDLHKTIPFLTKFEKAKILGLRAKQINDGAQTFVKVPVAVVNGYTIAQLEMSEKKLPFIIRRPIPNGCSEYWKLSDLENII